MLFAATYFVSDRFVGQSSFDCNSAPHNLAYFCSTCGTIWGRVAVSDQQQWRIEHVPCERHPRAGVSDWSSIPGGFLSEGSFLSRSNLSTMSWARAIEHLPEEVLKREFELTLKWFERKQENE